VKLNRLCSTLLFAAALASTASISAAQQTMTAPKPDPRVGLKAGTMIRWPKDTSKFVIQQKAAEAGWNLKLVSATPPSENFVGVTSSDLAFTGKYAIQGNYNGYQVWDISNAAKPVLATAYLCPASQSDVSVYNNLLFVSSESTTGRLDCGRGKMDSIDMSRVRGIRVFDGTDITKPKYLTNVQTCRGSHTHTVVTDPKDKDNVYIYISGTSGVRPVQELKGCLDIADPKDPNTARFRLEVIKIPLAHPEQAAMVNTARIFQNLPASPANIDRCRQDSTESAKARAAAIARGDTGGRGGRGRPVTPCAAPPANPTGPNQCHDITVYPTLGLAGGACAGLGLLLDIRNPTAPNRVDFVADSNFSFWHSATFNNDGTKILFTDEWGGGSAPRCRSTDKMSWGADALFTLVNNKMTFKSYYKMPAPQTGSENCVAHNGSLIPIPGRDVMVQSWYQGGVSVFDWTDVSHPKEIAFFDRGPLDVVNVRPVTGGSWSAYWYNGVIVSSEIVRGLDIFELQPSAFLTQNEIDAAKTVHYTQLNVQDQPKMVWPASFSLARAFVDQLDRSKGLAAARITAVRSALTSAESATGAARKSALTQLGTQLDADASASSDKAKVAKLSAAVKELAK
jgi:hypothetical protein